ncbi:GPR1/FUN34/yaaH family-domain-containing protein [Mycena rosella]|uniref:GPR1/FUN34/yaaH family-domain-containing protein n=1 Tax=Mycena rosella TaxID=1033263 RepID=A0AAD7CNP2_MYCRO|nr:GPR1/FUN34/yaaH family-domain-containing protein [Mycena rosella]
MAQHIDSTRAVGYPHTHDAEKGTIHTEEVALGTDAGAHHLRSPIQLTAAQYERLFFQPGGPAAARTTPRQLGNPTAFAIISYLLALTPTVVVLMRWGRRCAGLAYGDHWRVLFYWGHGDDAWGRVRVLGNTFPFIVFSSFGGFWLSLGVLFDPSKQIASAFPDGGTASPEFNHGVQFYFIFWAVLCVLYFVASLRTNVVFAYIFATLVCTFAFLAAGYRQAGLGNAALSLTFLRAAGAFGFANILAGWYLAAVLVLAAVEMPWALPVGDLSGWGRLRRKVE